MASQYYTFTSLFKENNISSKASYRRPPLVNISPLKCSKICMQSSSSSITLCANTNYTACKRLVGNSPQVDANNLIEELRESTRRSLTTTINPKTTLKLIDTIQRLGVGYYFEHEINDVLEKVTCVLPDKDLYTTALCFRLQRYNGLLTNPDVFQKFMDANGDVKNSSSDDIEGLLSLYEASCLGATEEDILSQAKESTIKHLQKLVSELSPKLHKKVIQGLELPRHMRMERLEARMYIQEYGNEDDHNPSLLEFAKLDYNRVQSLLQEEMVEVTRWWKLLGLDSKLSFVRDRHVECFLWALGLLPEPNYTSSRIKLAKIIALMLVIDDIYDTYGSYDDLVLFTKAIQRWDLNEMEQLPEYMKVCYLALYNTNKEICDKVLKECGLSVQPYLRKAWIDMVEGYMVEVEWVKRGSTPKLEEYIENGVTTSGTCMALVHLFVLISEGVTNENIGHLLNPYPKFFTLAGTILRLWDDLGTAKEEQERGDELSSLQLLMKEKNITCEKEGREHILQLIHGLWKDLNTVLVTPNVVLLPIIRVALNTSRASQVVYQHNEDSYLSSVETQVQSLFFKSIDI